MTQCHCVQQHNLPFDAVHYQQSIFQQRFPPFQFCSTRPMSPKKRLIMFYDQNCFSKQLIIFSAIHNSSKLFGILCHSHLIFYFGWSDTSSPHYTGCPKKSNNFFSASDPFWYFGHLMRLKLQNFKGRPP